MVRACRLSTMRPHRRFVVVAGAVSLVCLVLGFCAGTWFGFRFDRVYVTDQDVADRIAECSLTMRIVDQALDQRDVELQRLVSGDAHQCHFILSTFPEKIRARDRASAERILNVFERMRASP